MSGRPLAGGRAQKWPSSVTPAPTPLSPCRLVVGAPRVHALLGGSTGPDSEAAWGRVALSRPAPVSSGNIGSAGRPAGRMDLGRLCSPRTGSCAWSHLPVPSPAQLRPTSLQEGDRCPQLFLSRMGLQPWTARPSTRSQGSSNSEAGRAPPAHQHPAQSEPHVPAHTAGAEVGAPGCALGHEPQATTLRSPAPTAGATGWPRAGPITSVSTRLPLPRRVPTL